MLRRRPKTRTLSKLHRCGKTVVEAMEARLLMTTVITDTNPLTATPAEVTFEYKDLKGDAVRVVVFGDVSAEFIFAKTEKKSSTVGGDSVLLPSFVSAGSKEDGRDLFHVFVAQASIDSYISIAKVAQPTTPGPRPMLPFDGNVTFNVFPTRGNTIPHSTDGGTGSIVLGTRSVDTPIDVLNEADRPRVVLNFNGAGLLPANSKGKLVAGLSTAPGVSLGRFLFGGCVMGAVNIQGSMESFYAGQLMTGATQGQIDSDPLVPGNFFVSGDIRNILSKGTIGSDGVEKSVTGRVAPQYVTGVDIDVRGRVGQIKTGGDYVSFAKVSNTNDGLGLRTRQQEIEIQADKVANRGSFTQFENGEFGDLQTFFNNNTFETAQFLGSINSKTLGDNSVHVNGVIQAFVNYDDIADYYAVPLMAGQQVTVRMMSPVVTTTNGIVTSETPSILNVGVFDPDERLIATDFSPGSNDNINSAQNPNADPDPAHQQEFTFIADRPGIYRFAVAYDAPSFGTTGDRLGEFPYQLRIQGVGNLAIGGVVAQGTINCPSTLSLGGGTFNNPRTDILGLANIQTIRGDLGALYSIGDNIVSFADSGLNALARGGDLRAFDAESIGTISGATISSTGGNLFALTGSVGMVRARNTDRTAAITRFNLQAPQSGLPNIGGDVQYVSAMNTLSTDLAANGSVGVMHVAQWGLLNLTAGSVSANADGTGKPGVIDLIDVTLDMGTIGRGGPVISTGPGGNVRYIHISPTSTAYRPLLFGASQPEETFYLQGQQARITEDSGAQIEFTPTEEELTDAFGQPILDPVTFEPLTNSGSLTILTYPIARGLTNAGGGGVVVIRATSTRGMTVRTNGGSTEIGEIQSTGSGPSLIQDPGTDGIPNSGDEDLGPDGLAASGDEPFVIDPNSTNDNSVDLRGSMIDVFKIRGNNFNAIRNLTGGEVVNTDIGQIGRLEGTNLGTAKSSIRSGMITQGAVVADMGGTSEVEGSTFPFLDTRNAIIIRGTSQTDYAISELLASEAIGNVMILGVVGEIVANSDSTGIKGVIEGITGAVFVKGQLRFISVGEGLMPSGSGNMGKAGIYCVADDSVTTSNPGMGRIERVVNQGPGSDLRGTIGATTGIGRIEVSNGSIINATFAVLLATGDTGATRTGADLAPTSAFSGAAFIRQGTDRVGNTLGNIDRISVVGDGGIIGLFARTNNMGRVVSSGGYGIINSTFTTLGNGRFDDVVADGYGIRGVLWRGGQSLDSITVNGDGSRLKTTSFSPGVRLSESLPIDPFFGTKPNPMTDLHVVLGTTKQAPTRKGTSASGSLDLSEIRVSRDVGTITANTIRATTFNVANNIGTIATRDYVDTLEITTGRIDTLSIGKDALRTDISVSGPVGVASIGGSFRGSSRLQATGPNGQIGKFITGKTLYGNVYASQRIDSIRVGTHYGSQGTRSGGSLGEFITNGNVSTASVLSVNKTLSKLVIGGNFEDGATIKADVFGNVTIVGEDNGDLITT